MNAVAYERQLAARRRYVTDRIKGHVTIMGALFEMAMPDQLSDALLPSYELWAMRSADLNDLSVLVRASELLNLPPLSTPPVPKGNGQPGAPQTTKLGITEARNRSRQGTTLLSLEAEAEAIIDFLGLKCSTSGLANALRGQFPQLLISAEFHRREHNANSAELALWYNSVRKNAKMVTPADIDRWNTL